MNDNMMISLDEEDMLELWKTRLRLLPARRDCVIERDDGIDIDQVLLQDIKEWYAWLLWHGNVAWLPVEDVSNDVMAQIDDEGVVTVPLPSQCVRPVEWKLGGWKCGVTRFYQPGSYEAMCQRNIYLRGDIYAPVAVLHDNRLVLYSLSPGDVPSVSVARCVVRPADGSYRFSQAALSTMHSYLAKCM